MKDYINEISIVVPVYNRKDYIMDTLDSILGQSFLDFELIVVDDGSKDKTAELVKSIKDKRIKYIYQDNSGLPAAARNTGLKIARGKYIAFCDSDDLWESDKLKAQMEVFDAHKDAELVYTNFVWHDGKKDSNPFLNGGIAKSGDVFYDLIKENFIPMSSVMVKKSILDEVGCFDEDPKIMAAEDYDLWLRIALFGKIYFLNKVLVKYRQHFGMISSNRDPLSLDILVLNKLWGKYRKNIDFYKYKSNLFCKKLFSLYVAIQRIKNKIKESILK